MRPPVRIALAALMSVLAIGLALVISLDGSRGHSTASSSGAPATAQHTGFEGAAIAGQQPHSFTLSDQRGRRVALTDYRGRVVVLGFLASTGPSAGVSRLMAQQVRGALADLRTPAVALGVSTNPRGDTPARVSAFLRRVGLAGRLEYLTGTTPKLRAVWRAYAIAPPTPGQSGPDRSAYVVLIDKRGVQRVRFYVENLTPEALAHDIRKLQAG